MWTISLAIAAAVCPLSPFVIGNSSLSLLRAYVDVMEKNVLFVKLNFIKYTYTNIYIFYDALYK